MGELAQGLWDSLAGRYTLERGLGRGGMAVVSRFQAIVEGTA
jgi:hypothetical protein